jgi:hypothetical protein
MNTEENQPNVTRDNGLYSLYLAIPRFVDTDSDAPILRRSFVHDGASYRATLYPAPASRETGATSRRYLGPMEAATERAFHTIAFDPDYNAPRWQVTTSLTEIVNQLSTDGIEATL